MPLQAYEERPLLPPTVMHDALQPLCVLERLGVLTGGGEVGIEDTFGLLDAVELRLVEAELVLDRDGEERDVVVHLGVGVGSEIGDDLRAEGSRSADKHMGRSREELAHLIRRNALLERPTHLATGDLTDDHVWKTGLELDEEIENGDLENIACRTDGQTVENVQATLP